MTKLTVLAASLCVLLAAGCTYYPVMVRLYDEHRKPVMEASIAVEGKYIAGHAERAGKKEPLLEEFFAMKERTCGEFFFYALGEPDSLRVSADAPGFHKFIGKVKRIVAPDGFAEYRVVEACSPYLHSGVIVKKKGLGLFIDIFLKMHERRRRPRDYRTESWR